MLDPRDPQVLDLRGGQSRPDIDVIDQAADGNEAVTLARRLRPDVEEPMAVVVIITFDTGLTRPSGCGPESAGPMCPARRRRGLSSQPFPSRP